MDSCRGPSSCSYLGELLGRGDVDERKRKRMISNRESARRSRMRKRKHADDLTAQVGQLIVENSRIVRSVGSTVQLYLDVEAENSILRARVVELRSQLELLNWIVNYVNSRKVFCGRTTEIDDGYVNCDMWEGMDCL